MATVGVALADAAGVTLVGTVFWDFTTCQTSLAPLLTHVNDAVLVFATAPSFVQAMPAFGTELEAEKAKGAERIPMANTEVARSSEIFFGVIRKTVPLTEC